VPAVCKSFASCQHFVSGEKEHFRGRIKREERKERRQGDVKNVERHGINRVQQFDLFD
jgi:hypothetical protein